jgi:hypothetical protein
MTQVPSKLVEVVSALETLELPYVLFREPSGSHRVLVEGSPEAAVLNALRNAIGPDVLKGIGPEPAPYDVIVERARPDESAETIIIEVKQGTSKSGASMLWWLALQEGSRAARSVALADRKALEIITLESPRSDDKPE